MYRTVTIGSFPAPSVGDAGASVPVTLSAGDKGEPDLVTRINVTRDMTQADFVGEVNRLARTRNVQESFLSTLANGQSYQLANTVSPAQQARLDFLAAMVRLRTLRQWAADGITGAATDANTLAGQQVPLYQFSYSA